MARIVVGIDGSEGAEKALRWALEEARLRRARLEVVNVWSFPTYSEIPGVIAPELAKDMQKEAELLIENALKEAAGGGEPGVEVVRTAVEGPTARMLVVLAADADLLVVGSRGRGGFKGLLLGSVSQQCAHHAPCPVVIVPPPGNG